jgi:glucose-1-phosphate thymidylyltransferase
MYPLTKNRPKPLLPVGGKPALDYLIEEIMSLQEINDIYIVTNDRFVKHFIEWETNWDTPMKKMGKSIHLINDGSTSNDNRLGVAKDLDFVFQQTSHFSEVLVVGGDNIPLFRLKEYWLSFLNKKDHFVMALMDEDKSVFAAQVSYCSLKRIRFYVYTKNQPTHHRINFVPSCTS